jgi:hypothetical protein
VSTTSTFLTTDIGNRKLKYRLAGEGWVAEDSLVRLATAVSDDMRGGRLSPFVYLEGPAAIDADPDTGKLRRRALLIGPDALRGGSMDLSRVGTAALRITSDAYKAQLLYTLARSLPKDLTHEIPEGKKNLQAKPLVEADITYAGGLPGESAGSKPELLAWLKGDGRSTVHHFTLGNVEYRLRVSKALIIAQHIAVTASLSFSEGGAPLANGALNRKRLVLDPGGGTTDYGGNVGLDVIPGTEGTVRKAAWEIAAVARDLIHANHVGLTVSVLDVLTAMDMPEPSVFKAGVPVSVRAELVQAAEQVTMSVLTDVTPRWETHLAQAEVCIAGGTGVWMLPTVRREFRGIKVTLLDDAIFRVGYGLERLGRHKLRPR